ncbi:MAG: hypothetical protein AAF658_11515, partial [Myxococcota bacterium]
FNRGAVMGVALATFAGVVAAPAVLWLMAEEHAAGLEVGSEGYGNDYRSAGISIESLEVTGDGSARVLNNEGATTLIWLDGDDSQEWDGEDAEEYEEP